MKRQNYFYLCMIGLLIALFVGYANNHSFTNDYVKMKQDSINSLSFDNEMLHKAVEMGCPKDTTIINPILYEMSRTLGKPKTFKVKRK